MGDRRLGKILWLVPVRDAINFIIWIAVSSRTKSFGGA